MSRGSASVYVIAYDIRDNTRRSHVKSVILGYGRRVQYSVYTAYLTPLTFAQLHRDISAAIDSCCDHVIFIQTGIESESKTRVIEIGTPLDDFYEPESWIM